MVEDTGARQELILKITEVVTHERRRIPVVLVLSDGDAQMFAFFKEILLADVRILVLLDPRRKLDLFDRGHVQLGHEKWVLSDLGLAIEGAVELLYAEEHIVSAADSRFIFDVLAAFVLDFLANHDLLDLAELEKCLFEDGALEKGAHHVVVWSKGVLQLDRALNYRRLQFRHKCKRIRVEVHNGHCLRPL